MYFSIFYGIISVFSLYILININIVFSYNWNTIIVFTLTESHITIAIVKIQVF